jgi:glucokinase
VSDKQVYAGIDIGGTNIKFGLFDADGQVLHRQRQPTLAQKGAAPLMHLVGNIGEDLLLSAAEEELEVLSLGVGTPGAVDFRTGQVIGTCPNIDGWQGTEIGRTLSERLNLPVYVDNDVHAMALAESRFGAASGYDSVVCVTVGTGVGGAVIINGQLWRGANYAAGELGHMSIKFDSDVVHGGMPGSIEAYCSSSALVGRIKARLQQEFTPAFETVLDGNIDNLTIRKMFTAIRKHDAMAQAMLDETAEYLGFGLAGVVNLLNPEVVVIGGGVADGGGGFVEAVSAKIKELAFPAAVEKLKVRKASLGNDAGFIGAGLLGESLK